MRIAIGCVLAFHLIAGASLAADDKIDPKKLVGKWQPKDAKLRIELTADGKLAVVAKEGDKEFTSAGTWKLDGAKLAMTLQAGENETRETMTILKLTDDELVVETETKDMRRTLLRVK